MGGEFAVAGTLPTIQDVIDFKEGNHRYKYGYYRFVDHPYLKRITQALRKFYTTRHCLLMTSPETAFYELIDHLITGAEIEHIAVIGEHQTPSIDWENAFHSFPEIRPKIYPPGEAVHQSKDTTTDTIWILAVHNPGEFLRSNDSLSAHLAERHAPLILFADHLKADLPEFNGKQFAVIDMFPGDETLAGAAILGNADRMMLGLRNRLKQRGPMLSSRNAARVLTPDHSHIDTSDNYSRVAKRIASLENGTEAFLYPSGMNAVAS
ncbi:MAG TPA: hypothetical protein VKA68_15715, partial [bacterium]|nr:hypothetical protein [bacterium]